MLLSKAKQLIAFVFAHQQIAEMAAKGNKLSSHQTDHGMKHFLEVVEMARKLALMVNSHTPGTFSQWELEVIIPLAALLHDIGRAIDVERHDAAGAKWSRDFLLEASLPGDSETLPKKDVNRICKIIACHRSRVVLKREFDDACWALVVIADKFVGDEERVRPVRAVLISLLTLLGLSHIKLRSGGVHDQVNFAIKELQQEIADSQVILTQVIDPRVCQPRLIVDTYGDRYLACHKACQFLGLGFALEVASRNAWGPVAGILSFLGFVPEERRVRYSYDETAKSWVLVQSRP